MTPVKFARFCAEHGVPFGDHLKIADETLGVSMLCVRGKMLAYLVEEHSDRHFRIHDSPYLVAAATRLVEAIGFDGVAQCQGAIDRATGLGHLTSCRPYFSRSIYPAMIAGINFADAAINLTQGILPPQATLPPTALKLYPAAIRALPTPWRLSRHDWRLLAYHLREHELFLAERFKRIDDSDVAVRDMGDDVSSLSPRERLAS